MHIGLIATSFLPRVGGIEWKVHYLATEYAGRGHDVTVFAGRPSLSPFRVTLPFTPEYNVVRPGFPIAGIDRTGISSLLFAGAILVRHRAKPFSVLHTHHLGLPTAFGLLVKRFAGVPVVATTCGGDMQMLPEAGYGDRRQPRFDRLIRKNVLRADVIGSISRAMRGELERLGTTARIVDIPNGVEWESFQIPRGEYLRRRLEIDDDVTIVLSVGRNQPVKGFELGLRAFAEAAGRQTRCVYVMVGRGIPKLRPLATELGVERRVFLLDQIEAVALPEMFRSADLFFSPSLMEGFSQVNAQAMASGLPCVLTDAPGNVDAGMDGGALIARSRDVSSMADCLGRLIEDAGLRRQLGEEAHRASPRYAWSRIADSYLRVFEELGAASRN